MARVSPSGYYIASGDSSGNLRVWDVANSAQSHLLKYTGKVLGSIKDLAWDFESKRIAVVGSSNQGQSSGMVGVVVTFDAGNQCGEIIGHSKSVNACSFDPTGRPFKLVTASDDGLVNFFENMPLKFQSSLDHHSSRFVQDIQYSPDGLYFISVGSDGKANIFDGTTGEFKYELFYLKDASIYAVAWSPDAQKVYLACADGKGRILNVESREVIREILFDSKEILERQQVGCLWILTKTKNEVIISLSGSGCIQFFVPTEDTPFQTFFGHNSGITDLLPLDNFEIITRDLDDHLFRSNLQNYTNTELTKVIQPIRNIFILNGIQFFLYESKCIQKIDVSGVIIGEKLLPFYPSQCFAASDKYLVALYDTTVSLIDCESLELKESTKISTSPISAFSCEGGMLSFGTEDGTLHIYILAVDSLDSLLQPIKVSSSAITCLSFKRVDYMYIAVGDSNRTIKLFKMDKELINIVEYEWVFHTSKITHLAWFSDGSRLVSAALDNKIILWDPKDPSWHQTISNAHNNTITGLYVTPDNRIVSTSMDSTIAVWKL